MFVVESLPSRRPTDVAPAYELVGPEDEVSKFKRALGALSLGGYKTNPDQFPNTQAFVRDLVSIELDSAISEEHEAQFRQLVKAWEKYIPAREDALFEAAANGLLTMQQVLAELDDIEFLITRGAYGSVSGERIKWLNKDGLAIDEGYDPNEHVDLIRIDTNDIEEQFGPEVAKTAAETGANQIAPQYELTRDKDGKPVLLSGKTHTTLGTYDENGFTPVLTVLNQEHPHVKK